LPGGEGIYVGAVQHPEAAVRTYLARFAVLLLVALTGCHLIDQTDFEPKQAVKPAVAAVADPDTRPALVTIDYASANPDYTAALTAAVQAAETRRPGLLYDVVAVVATAAEAPTGRTRAAEVMTKVEANGVIPARIRLALRLDPGRKVPQIRVYLR
jgi:hypothetical protein